MTGQIPEYKILTKDEQSGKLSEIAAIWATSKAETFSVRLKVGDQEIKGIMVKNKPRAAAEPTAPSAKKPPASQRKPAP